MPSPTELIAHFQRAQAAVTDRIDAVEPGRWDVEALPGWSVTDLVASLVEGQRLLVATLAGESATRAGRVPEEPGELLGDDPLLAWETAADEALAAVAADGALERSVATARGPRPAAEVVAQQTAELAVHAVDLARATGQDDRLDDELVAAALDTTDRLAGDPVWGGAVEPADAPAGASPQERLLARHGRTG